MIGHLHFLLSYTRFLTTYSITGRAALQKRIMALLRQLDRQTAGNVQVKHVNMTRSSLYQCMENII